jgi:ribulose-5-phosphate 4-epimerase/fuculose-1-phosphate aldolase
MADGAPAGTAAVRTQVSAAEWKARVELAALYRLVALYGWDDAIFTHISMRVPAEAGRPDPHHFLINPYGVFFEEMTASALVKVDLDGQIVMETPYYINPAGFTIHSAVHAAREDATCVMHLHTDAGVGVSAQAEGLLPISQNALILIPQLAYHGYEGIALNLDERERLVANLGNKGLMLLRNHGTLSCGASAAQTWLQMFFLERACAQQVAALSAGRAGLLKAPDEAVEAVFGQTSGGGPGGVSHLAWPGFLRRLDRRLPGYDA